MQQMDTNRIKQFVLKNLHDMTIEQMYQVLKQSYGYTTSFTTFKTFVLKLKKKEVTIKVKDEELDHYQTKIFQLMTKHRVMSIIDVSNFIDSSPYHALNIVSELAAKGYEISHDERNVYLGVGPAPIGRSIQKPIEDSTEIIFGVPADLHFGSKACQITALNEFCEICRKQGVKFMFTPGDVFAGFNVYRGQLFDLYAISSGEQEESVIVNLPQGFEWYMLGGNHDYSFIKSGPGHNAFNILTSARKDTHYCGFDEALVPILKGVDLKMWHPSGGVPYALSYRIQKGIEQIAFSELQNISRSLKDKPTIRFVLSGHLHVQMQAMFGSIFGAQCGSFEGTNNLLKRKGIVPAVGGWIIKATLGKNNLLKCFDAKFYLFEEIEDDWKNYRHYVSKVNGNDKPVFDKD
jgi:UDP-2,3-diacylglucosamine pyrophosphatase LpxH